MREIILTVEGMVCGGCENRVQNVVSKIEGVKEVKADYQKGIVTITTEKEIEKDVLKEKIENLGFEVKE